MTLGACDSPVFFRSSVSGHFFFHSPGHLLFCLFVSGFSIAFVLLVLRHGRACLWSWGQLRFSRNRTEGELKQ